MRGEPATIPVGEALALVALTFVALATLGAPLAAQVPGGSAVAELGCVALPTMVWLGLRRVPPAALGVGPARLPGWPTLGGLLAGAGAFYLVAISLEVWLERLWPTPPALREALTRMILPPTGARPLPLDLLTLALVPALAEELLFRGVLYGAVRPRLGTVGAIVATALLFGLYHGSPHRFVPAALGGLLLGSVRAASGTLAAPIAFHFANNAGVVIALRLGYETPPARALPLVAAAITGALGLILIRWRRWSPAASS